MAELKHETLAIQSCEDVVRVRQKVREFALGMGFTLVDQTKSVTAASELARTTIDYGGGGIVHLECLQNGHRSGLQLVFEDQGPGIADIDLALKGGFTSGSGLGLGLGGSKRLSNEFEITSQVGSGTRVRITKWR
jgi:serine/threonine-protein kinase RsbT